MKINIADPTSGAMKWIEIDDEKKLQHFYDRRISQEIEGEAVGDEFAGYVFRISGGNDKQGFPMMQGVLTNYRVRIMLGKGQCYFRPRKQGERRRKSVRGCIVGPDLSVLNLTVVKRGENPVPGLNDEESYRPRRLGPKRANKIRKLFNLTKEDDVRKFVVTRTVERSNGKTAYKRPAIQRLVTPVRLARRARVWKAKDDARAKAKAAAAEYKQMMEQRAAERRASAAHRRSERRSSRRN